MVGNMPPRTRRQRLIRFHLLLAIGLALAGMLAVWLLVSRTYDWAHWAGCWLAAVNVTTFGYFGYDKASARSGSGRIPEIVLYVLAAIGGSVGAFLGMKAFRHKTIKGKFQILFWCIVILQVALALWIAKSLWWG